MVKKQRYSINLGSKSDIDFLCIKCYYSVMEKDDKELLLKVIVGSRAHGLHNESSDFDYRGVFVVPTEKLLALGPVQKHTSWIEDQNDDTSWEVGKFLFMATKCNPTILETFVSPIVSENDLGKEIRELFPHVWNSRGVKDAFIGYGLNQRKKFFENQDNRAPKYATAYLRTLYNAHELLTTGHLTMNMAETPIFDTLKRFKAGEFEIGEVIQVCYEWQTKVELAYKANPNKESNLEPVNELLLKIRKHYWKG